MALLLVVQLPQAEADLGCRDAGGLTWLVSVGAVPSADPLGNVLDECASSALAAGTEPGTIVDADGVAFVVLRGDCFGRLTAIVGVAERNTAFPSLSVGAGGNVACCERPSIRAPHPPRSAPFLCKPLGGSPTLLTMNKESSLLTLPSSRRDAGGISGSW